jgi:cytochrome c peroxidase
VGEASALALLVVALASGTAIGAQEIEIAVPEGVLPPEVPENNPLTDAKVALGRKLYFDTRISTDGTVACATCHDPRHGFTDGRGDKTSKGVGGQLGTRNSPTVLNAAFLSDQFWDGRAGTLEDQAKQPLTNPIEHGFKDEAAVAAKLRELTEYAPLFEAAFGSKEISVERFSEAVASFERTLVSLDAPIDRFMAGDKKAISESAQRGWELFNGKARCNTCHGYVGAFPLFTDEDFHNLGVGTERIDAPGGSNEKDDFEAVARKGAGAVAAGKDLDVLVLTNVQASELGRFVVTKEPKHIGAFKTPQLRNIGLTAPYMHDGSEPTLEKVIELYDRGGNQNPFIDGGMRPLNLTAREKADLVELMKTFTSDDLSRFDDLKKEMAGR